MTDQLRAMAAYASENGLQAVLYVSHRASSEVHRLFKVIVVPF